MKKNTAKQSDQKKNSDNIRNAAVNVGAAVAGAGTVLGAEAILKSREDEPIDVIDNPVADTDVPVEEVVEVNELDENNVAENEVKHTEAEERNAEVTFQKHDEEAVAENVQPVTDTQTEIPNNPQSSYHTQQPTSNTAQAETPQPAPGNPDEVIVDPDQIAEAIIAETQIDANDIDANSDYKFEETVYTVDGLNMTAASFQDASGHNLVMVDVDGDNTFDVVTDENIENVISEVAIPVTVDDVMLATTDDNTYMARTEQDNIEEFGADTLNEDIITT